MIDGRETITLHTREHGKVVVVAHPWPKRAAISRDLLTKVPTAKTFVLGTPMPFVPHGLGDRRDCAAIFVSNGYAIYEEVANTPHDEFVWCGELIDSEYRPPEREAAIA